MNSVSKKLGIGAGIVMLAALAINALVFFGKLGGPLVESQPMAIVGFVKSIIKGETSLSALVQSPLTLIEITITCVISISTAVSAICLLVGAIKAFAGKSVKGVKRVKVLGAVAGLSVVLHAFVLVIGSISGGSPDFKAILLGLKDCLLTVGFLVLFVGAIVLGIFAKVIKKKAE